jgi:hypothetical protein
VELVELAERWSRAEELPVRVVFDGPAPDGAVGAEDESADDLIAREAALLADHGDPYWLVTSDRGLRARAGRAAEKRIGGGAFVRKLRSVADDRYR